MPIKKKPVFWFVYVDEIKYPGCFIARRCVDQKPTRKCVMAPSLGEVQAWLKEQGYAPLDRNPSAVKEAYIECWVEGFQP